MHGIGANVSQHSLCAYFLWKIVKRQQVSRLLFSSFFHDNAYYHYMVNYVDEQN